MPVAYPGFTLEPETGDERIGGFREIVLQKQHAMIDGVIVDLFTASAVVQVYDALNPDNQHKLSNMPAPKLVSVVWKLLKKVGG
jgi:hypothetical protein